MTEKIMIYFSGFCSPVAIIVGWAILSEFIDERRKRRAAQEWLRRKCTDSCMVCNPQRGNVSAGDPISGLDENKTTAYPVEW